MAPDFERLARMPCPIASLASSGTSPLSSGLAVSCSRKAVHLCRKSPANSAQELDELMSTTRTASIRGRGGSTPNRRGGSAFNTAPEALLGCEQKVLVEGIGRDTGLDPFTASRDDREHRVRGVRHPRVMLKLRIYFAAATPRKTTTAA